jgi:hypothetical protein
MKKLLLLATLALTAGCAAVSTAQAGGGGYPFKPGCCGGFTGHPHWGWGGGVSIGLVDTIGSGDCYYVRRTVLVPNIGLVSRRQLVCE